MKRFILRRKGLSSAAPSLKESGLPRSPWNAEAAWPASLVATAQPPGFRSAPRQFIDNYAKMNFKVLVKNWDQRCLIAKWQRSAVFTAFLNQKQDFVFKIKKSLVLLKIALLSSWIVWGESANPGSGPLCLGNWVLAKGTAAGCASHPWLGLCRRPEQGPLRGHLRCRGHFQSPKWARHWGWHRLI